MGQAANKMIQKLRDLPMEKDDAFQNIDEDDLAQGLAQRFSQSKETNKSMNGSHAQQVSKFHKNLKSSQGDMLSELQELQLSEIEDCVAKLEAIALEQHFERRQHLLTLRKRARGAFTNAWYRCPQFQCRFAMDRMWTPSLPNKQLQEM